MNETDLVHTALNIGEKIDFLWNFYVTACAVLIGWLFSTRITWNAYKQRTILLLFLMFAAINAYSMFSNYHLLELVLVDLKELVSYSNNSLFVAEFSNSNGLGSYGALIIHFIADFSIYMLIKTSVNITRKIEE